MLWLKRWQTHSGWSLRRTLLTVLLPGMLLVVSAQMALTWRSTLMAADAAYDRSLFGAIRAIDASISTESGGLAMELPYRTLELFELTASGRVHFRLLTEDGLVEIGDPAMPLPEKLPLGQPVFQDAVYQDTSIRLGTYKRLLDRPLAGQTERQAVIIQVAEPLTPRETFTPQLVVQVVSRDILLVGVGCLLIVFAIAWSLQPLLVLRQQVLARSPSDLSLLQAQGVPSDVQPLILALNHHLERTKTLLEDRRRFIDDASHQLRTPLATLTTQLSYALREPDTVKQKEALFALRAQLEETVRQTNQMLALARADSAGLSPQSFDLVVFVQRICRAWWSSARQGGVNLDLDMDESLQRVMVTGEPELLQEALVNLLHNAIRYAGDGGHVRVDLHIDNDKVFLCVTDDGPGIPSDELHHAGERFFRATNAVGYGSGIGLAVVRSIVQRHGGQLTLQPGNDGRGLKACISLLLTKN